MDISSRKRTRGGGEKMSWLFPLFVAGAIRASDNMRQMSNEIDRLRAEVARQNKPVQDTAEKK